MSTLVEPHTIESFPDIVTAIDFRNLADALPQLIWVTRHSDGALEYLNQRWYDYTGLSWEQTRSDGWKDILHPDDAAPQAAAWKNARTSGLPFVYEYRLRQQGDGQYHWFLIREVPIRVTELLPLSDTPISHWVGTATDITERKQLEQLLSEREAALSEAQAIARIGSWEYTMATDKIAWSQEMFRLLQFDPAQGAPDYSAFLECFPPDAMSMLDTAIHCTATKGESYAFDIQVIRKDGSSYWLHVTGRAVRDQRGEIYRVLGTAQDITERKNLEAEKDALLAAAEKRADHDSLTSLLNRRAFQERLEQELARLTQALRSPKDNSLDTTPVACGILLFDLDNFKFFNDAYGHAAGDDVLLKVTSALRYACDQVLPPTALRKAAVARLGGDEFAVLLPGTGREATALCGEVAKEEIARGGFLPPGQSSPVPLGASCGWVCVPDEVVQNAMIPSVEGALALADERLYHEKQEGRGLWSAALRTELSTQIPGFAMLDALVTAVDAKDRYTRRHTEEVLVYTDLLGQELGLSGRELWILKVGSLLHDVGKIGIPDRILRMPGGLTEEDYDMVRQHPLLGAAIVAGAAPALVETLPVIRNHHERWDGKGYPDGMAGEQIPIVARITAVADAFAAMMTNRPYRRSMSQAEAMEQLRAGAGTQWDQQCVEAFLRAYSSKRD